MRWIRLVLAALVSVGVVVVVGSAPASACSCLMVGTKGLVTSADRIVTGTLAAMQDPPHRRKMSSLDPITYTVDVDQTFKGEPLGEVVFTSPMGSEACGLEGMHVNRRYAFFLSRGSNGLIASLCGGTALTSTALEAQIAHVAGPPVAPNEHTGTDTPESNASGKTRIDQDLPAQSAVPGWMVATLAGGGSLVVAAGFAWWWRRHGVHT